MGDNPFSDNPFAVSSSNTNGTAGGSGGTWPGGTAGAWGNTTNTTAPPPSSAFGRQPSTFGGKGAGGGSTEADLSRREAELNRREAELRRLELELRSNPGSKRKNWPRYCPCIHHDIAGEIPAAVQPVVRSGYYAFLGLIICLFWNLVCTAGYLIANGSIATFLWGGLYFVGGIPGGWYLWYGRLYHSSIKDSAFGYGLFFLFFTTAHLIFTGWSALAPPILNSTSHAGFWITVQTIFPNNAGLGIIYFIGSGLWTLEFVWSFWTLQRVYGAFRGKGMTAADVKRDAARNAVAATV